MEHQATAARTCRRVRKAHRRPAKDADHPRREEWVLVRVRQPIIERQQLDLAARVLQDSGVVEQVVELVERPIPIEVHTGHDESGT